MDRRPIGARCAYQRGCIEEAQEGEDIFRIHLMISKYLKTKDGEVVAKVLLFFGVLFFFFFFYYGPAERRITKDENKVVNRKAKKRQISIAESKK